MYSRIFVTDSKVDNIITGTSLNICKRSLLYFWTTKTVCKDVEEEPHLIPVTNEQFERRSANTADEARLDINSRQKGFGSVDKRPSLT